MENYRVFREKRDYELLFPEEPKQQISEDWRDETMSSPIMSKIAEQQRKALIPLKEDLADWLSKLLGRNFGEASLMEDLQTGAALCELANIICSLALPSEKIDKHQNRPKSAYIKSSNPIVNGGRPTSVQSIARRDIVRPLPLPPKYKKSAQPGSFLARDNAANFITWCRQLGVDEVCMFESECLVLQKQPRNVILCLLDVARIAARHGIIAPELVELEEEIEEEEKRIKFVEQSQPLPISMNVKTRAKALKLDDAVYRIVDGPPFEGQIDIERLGEGRYRIEGKLIFVRMLRGRHVMVRVGGGWDTLEHYLIKHDPTHFIPKISAKEICDSLSRDMANPKSRSCSVSSTPNRRCATPKETMRILKTDKGYFVPLTRRPHSALK
ncbi:growth arrest-specific protein 2-like isoform X1 [Clavelina lepadiformis]|uniref:growth arrest-specific protein 2-like isoform X1 n=1 Tax=Clavelina lepadiformis TaxID=159417 RepID=UPI004041834D